MMSSLLSPFKGRRSHFVVCQTKPRSSLPKIHPVILSLQHFKDFALLFIPDMVECKAYTEMMPSLRKRILEAFDLEEDLWFLANFQILGALTEIL